MKISRFMARIKPGTRTRIPPFVMKKLGLTYGGKVNFRVTDEGKVEVTRALTPAEQRFERLRVRLLVARET